MELGTANHTCADLGAGTERSVHAAFTPLTLHPFMLKGCLKPTCGEL